MNKKRGKRKEVKHKVKEEKVKSTEHLSKKPLTTSVQSAKVDTLIKNTAALQKIMVGLSLNIDRLSKNITKMLSLFEDASKTFKEGKVKIEEEKSDTTALEGKMNQLMEQNKVVAQGLVLLEKFLSEKEDEETRPKPLPTSAPSTTPLPPAP